MTLKRPILVFCTALLAACGAEPSGDDGRAASGEVLEGTISDAMLPVDRVRSEVPLEDPEALAEARRAASGPAGTEAADGGEDGDQPAAEGEAELPESAADPAEDG
jgi:hypothetical protein